MQTTKQIFESVLTTPQKAQLYNSTVVPSVIYIMGNLYPDEKRASTLKKCRDIDKEVRKVLVKNNIKWKTTSNDHVYLPISKGGIGLKSIEVETEIQMVRKGIYIRSHTEMKEAEEKYLALQRGEWRNPLSDQEFVMDKYECPEIRYDTQNIRKNCSLLKKHIETTFLGQLQEGWARNMNYGRIFTKEEDIEIPASLSPLMDGWRFSLLHSAAEEQIHGLGCIPGRQKNCRKGCNKTETAYHVSSACITRAYTTRHDYAVHWILKTLLKSLGAPEAIGTNLQFGKATLNVDFEGKRKVEIRAGMKLLTEKRLHHNKPDIFIHLWNPEEILILEVSVAHLQNYRLQEKIKKSRYAINSCSHVDHQNVGEISRDLNLVGELQSLYNCPVHLGIFVIGCFGEIVATDEHKHFKKLLSRIGVTNLDMKILINKCSYSVAVSTSNIILKHLGS
ncbi:uncharacterized protein LOC123311637 [Coccinella septempunctata]|uniref:uncharacterized protein LOC123311637 n=1 Tax=Coccinella septempunctata TaxID=41139 RepID=UPI001D08723E|nr:uncharacterized protein LOC123311637 [Coccinella septempunctata]